MHTNQILSVDKMIEKLAEIPFVHCSLTDVMRSAKCSVGDSKCNNADTILTEKATEQFVNARRLFPISEVIRDDANTCVSPQVSTLYQSVVEWTNGCSFSSLSSLYLDSDTHKAHQ